MDYPRATQDRCKREYPVRTGSVVLHEPYFDNLGGGSGWVLLGFNLHTGQLENYWMADHAHAPAATVPVLVLDRYVHSYQMDFGAAVAKYVDAFFQNTKWEAVAARIAALPKAPS